MWHAGSSLQHAVFFPVAAPGLTCTTACGILVPPTRDRTPVPCIGRRIPNHWTTREVPHLGSCLALMIKLTFKIIVIIIIIKLRMFYTWHALPPSFHRISHLPIFQMRTLRLAPRPRSRRLNSVHFSLPIKRSGPARRGRLLWARGAAWRPDGERGKEPKK